VARNPKVLLIDENHSVPADRRVWGEAQTLHKAGYTVSVISPRGRFTDTAPYELRDGVAIYRFRMPFAGAKRFHFVLEYGWALAACFFLALRVWRKQGIDVLHIGNPPDFFFPLVWFFKLFGKRFIFDEHDLCPETYLSKFGATERSPTYRILRWCEWLSQRAADAVVVTNESYRDVVLQRGPVRPERVFVVRNSPNRTLFKERQPRPELKEGHAFMVVFVGVMGVQDGVDYLLRAAHHVVHQLARTDVFFAIVGTGEVWDDLQRLHGELGLDGHVRFTGRIPDEPMLDYLATADVGAAPDPSNPLNDISTMQKTLEFMAMGLPVVSFDLKESRYSAQDAAVYVSDNDAAAFGDAIVALVDDPERRRRMRAAGLHRIGNELSWERSEDALLAAYRTALA
jgi:glycosyltransferase involved in cell wall biosynthesis